jgi:hypothetical protein
VGDLSKRGKLFLKSRTSIANLLAWNPGLRRTDSNQSTKYYGILGLISRQGLHSPEDGTGGDDLRNVPFAQVVSAGMSIH